MLLPRTTEAIGIRRKLSDYSLDLSHQDGGPKAHGFARILGITLQEIDHLETEIKAGILVNPITSVRENRPYGYSCVVELPLRGVGTRSNRIAVPRSIGKWPAGTRGTAVSDHGLSKLIEVSDDQGQMLDLFEVAEEDLRLISKHPMGDQSA